MMEANKHPVYKIPAAGGENHYDCLTPMKPPEVSPEERLDIAEQRLEYEKQRFEAQTERMERVIRRVQYLVWGLWVLTALVIVASHFWR
jgi:hypothetical protein